MCCVCVCVRSCGCDSAGFNFLLLFSVLRPPGRCSWAVVGWRAHSRTFHEYIETSTIVYINRAALAQHVLAQAKSVHDPF